MLLLSSNYSLRMVAVALVIWTTSDIAVAMPDPHPSGIGSTAAPQHRDAPPAANPTGVKGGTRKRLNVHSDNITHWM
jgi:hypothetical protein